MRVSIWLTWKEPMRNTPKTVWSASTWWPSIVTAPRSGNRSPRKRSFKKWSKSAFCPLRRSRRQGCCPVDVFLADVGYLAPNSPLRFHALLHNGIFVMKTPFLYYEAAHRYLLEAKEVDENSWQVWANLATLSYFKGDNATGAKELQRAIELHGKPIDLDDHGPTPYLKEALEYAAGHGSNCGAPF